MTFLFLAPFADAQPVSLSWQDPNNNPPEVGGYFLYYWQSDWDMPASIAVGAQTSYMLSDLNVGQTYQFAVTAHDGQGGRESVYSNIVTHTLTMSTPVANFSAAPMTGTIPLTVAFNDTSTGSIDSWLWTFGDGGSSTDANPTHTYTVPGTYTVSLTVTGPGGSATATQSSLVTVIESDVSAQQVSLNWNDPNNDPAEVGGYFLYYWQSDWDMPGLIDVGDQTTYILNGLQTGQTYHLAVTAHNGQGERESMYSNIVTHTLESSQPDTDSDGLSDADEAIYGTDPNMADTDGDKINDGNEVALWGDNWEHNYDGDALANNLLDPDADNDGYADGLEHHYLFDPSNAESFPALSFLLETGELSIDQNWQRVTFKALFFDPIVIANPPSSNDADPVTVRVRNVTATGFEIRLQEWNYLTAEDAGAHQPETISYIAMERGSFTLEDGTRIEANQFSTDRTKFAPVSFSQPFQVTPVVVTTISSFNEADAVTGRLKAISPNGFKFRLQEEEGNVQDHAMETVSYIAWEPSSGTIDGITFDIGTTGNVVTHQFHTMIFAAVFTDTPKFLAEMQTTNGGDTATVRWQNKDLSGIEVNIAEEQSKDKEVKHATEVVGYFAIQ